MQGRDWGHLPAPGGQFYYANLTTGETTWVRPAELDDPAAGAAAVTATPAASATPRSTRTAKAAAAASQWVEYIDEVEGLPYYYNTATGESTWVIPADDDDDDDFEDDPAVEAEAAANSEKRAARRLKILEEIVSTEESYVAALQTLSRVYVEPLRMVADVPRGAIFSHADLDAIFLNITVITKVNEKFLDELLAERERWPEVNYAETFKGAARHFKGCYTRYVNNFDEAAATLLKISRSDAPGDKEKHRYLVGATKHPDAKGRDLRAFLIQPVQRVPRYRMLLEDLLNHTDDDQPHVGAITEALERISEVAKSFNEDKRATDDFATLRAVFSQFQDADGTALRSELLSYDQRIIKDGSLVKARLSHRQRRHLFLFNHLVVYAATSLKGLVVKGRIELKDGARVESLPSTQDLPYAFAIVAKGGKGYTWLAESQEEKDAWLRAFADATSPGARAAGSGEASDLLALVKPKPRQARIFVVQGGGILIKYNKRDGKSNPRWVCVTLDKLGGGELIRWGDARTHECKSEAKLPEATALIHGAKSSAFFKQTGTKKDDDWLCFSVVFKERTLDFAATNAEQLLDWYLALASLLPHSSEPLLDEPTLRTRIEEMALS